MKNIARIKKMPYGCAYVIVANTLSHLPVISNHGTHKVVVVLARKLLAKIVK